MAPRHAACARRAPSCEVPTQLESKLDATYAFDDDRGGQLEGSTLATPVGQEAFALGALSLSFLDALAVTKMKRWVAGGWGKAGGVWTAWPVPALATVRED